MRVRTSASICTSMTDRPFDHNIFCRITASPLPEMTYVHLICTVRSENNRAFSLPTASARCRGAEVFAHRYAVSAEGFSNRRARTCAGRCVPGRQRSATCGPIMVLQTSLRLVLRQPIAARRRSRRAARWVSARVPTAAVNPHRRLFNVPVLAACPCRRQSTPAFSAAGFARHPECAPWAWMVRHRFGGSLYVGHACEEGGFDRGVFHRWFYAWCAKAFGCHGGKQLWVTVATSDLFARPNLWKLLFPLSGSSMQCERADGEHFAGVQRAHGRNRNGHHGDRFADGVEHFQDVPFFAAAGFRCRKLFDDGGDIAAAESCPGRSRVRATSENKSMLMPRVIPRTPNQQIPCQLLFCDDDVSR